MKKKILASIAAGLVIIGGVITPAFGLLTPQLGVHYAEADTPAAADVGASSNDGGDDISTPDICGGNESLACNLMSAISEIITHVPLSLAAISGMVFDYSLWNSIQSGTYTKYDGDDGNEGIVVSGWKLVRDFTNLVFIFALFVIAFTLILDLDGGERVSMTSNPKRTLARVIMMALLVNFSFFLGRSVIDITNKVSLQFYSNMTKAPQPTDSDTPATADVNSFYTNSAGLRSISTAIISQVNPQAFVLLNGGTSAQAGTGFYATLFLTSLVAAFFGIFLIYIFISIAILFVSRTIGLYLAIIISPLAFVSYTVPFLQKQPYIGFDDWMKQFMGLAFMAPIFLFFVYIGIQFFQIPLTPGSGALSTAAQIFFKFAAIAMFFTLAKRIAKDMSGKIGDMSTSFVTGAVTSVATIGAAAATGGTSAALQATRQQIGQNATAISNRVLGNERTAALQQRLGGLRNFRNLGSNPGAAIAGLGGMITGSAVPGQIYDAGRAGAQIGRVKNFGNLREEVKARQAAEAKKKVDDARRAQEEQARRITATRTAYNYDERRAAQDKRDAEKAKGGTPATLGDGRAKAPEFTDTQEERIKRKLEANKAKIAGQNKPAATPTTAAPATPPTRGAGVTPRTAVPAKDAELTLRAKNNFNGNATFDRPKQNPAAGQKEESQKLTGIYDREKQAAGASMNVENLTVKNLNVQGGNKAKLPERTPGADQNGPTRPQDHATNLLSGIQMTPRATSGALNYRSTDFKPPTTAAAANSSVFGSEENDDIMRAQLAEEKPKPPAPEPIFGSEENDDILRAQITRPEPKPKPEPISDIDHSGIVQDNLPGQNGNFDFGGMGKPNDEE